VIKFKWYKQENANFTPQYVVWSAENVSTCMRDAEEL